MQMDALYIEVIQSADFLPFLGLDTMAKVDGSSARRLP